MQSADFLSAVFFYLKVGENLNQNWIVENLNNAFSTWNGKLGELWGLVTTGPQTFKGGAVWSVMQTLHNGMVGIGYALVVLFFAISLCKNTMNFHELKRPEAAIHYFLRFVAAKALVGYGIHASKFLDFVWSEKLGYLLLHIDPTENTIEEDQIITSADELCAELFNEVATDVFQEAKREHFYPDADDDEIAEIRRRWQPYLDLLPEYRSSCRAFHTAE